MRRCRARRRANELGRPSLEQRLRVIDRDREPERFGARPRGRRDLQRGDADHAARPVDQRPAAVAGIDRRVGLDQHHAVRVPHALTIPRVTVFCSTPSARPIAITSWPGRAAIAVPIGTTVWPGDGVLGRRRDVHHRRAAEHARRHRGAVRQLHRDVAVALDDVRVGDDELGSDEEAAAAARRRLDRHDRRRGVADDLLERQVSRRDRRRWQPAPKPTPGGEPWRRRLRRLRRDCGLTAGGARRTGAASAPRRPGRRALRPAPAA